MNSLHKLKNKNSAIVAVTLLLAIFFFLFWSFWWASEYWGDAYHNIWMIKQSQDLGSYFDYKFRHLVWLPAYRFLFWIEYRLFDTDSLNNFILPFLLQLWYLGISLRFIFAKLTSKLDYVIVAFVVLWPLPVIFGGFNMAEGLAICTVTSIFYLIEKP